MSSAKLRAAGASPGARAPERAIDLRFAYEPGALGVRVHVTNHGRRRIECCAPLAIAGPLAVRTTRRVFAAWEHTPRPQTWIPVGRTRTLRLASLDVSGFPYAQWEIFMATPERRVAAVRALYTSRFGGPPQTHAPPLALALAVVGDTGAERVSAACRLVLEPFSCRMIGIT